jgi:ligand-binding SRPBCC domain-containing protein
MYVLECEFVTRASISDTFAVFADPYNLAKITPPWLGFRIVTDGLVMRRGAEIDYSFRSMGVPMKWKTVISAYDPPSLFVDEALRSPYKFWRHQHTFRETQDGTAVGDRVEYALPFGPLGHLVHAVAVAPQLRQIFNYRQEAIAKLLGGAVRVRPPSIRSLD